MEFKDNISHPYEPDQHELPPKPEYSFHLNRRKFFKILGSGLAVAFVFQDVLVPKAGASVAESSLIPEDQIGAWIHIAEDGTIKVFTGKVEVGQNIRTSLSQIVAEELRVPLESIQMVMGDTDQVPYDAGTFGSRTTPYMGPQLRKAAATAREALVEMAAKKWNVKTATLKAEKGMVLNPSTGAKINYGILTQGQQLLMPISENVTVTPASEWKISGKTVSKINGRSFITGEHQYVTDLKLPDMVYGKILRAPAYESKLMEVDLSRAEAMPNVKVVRDGDFVGVVAPNSRIAAKAIKAIRAKWDTKDQPSRAEVFDYLVKNSSEGSNRGGRNSGTSQGDLQSGLDAADITHKNTFHIDYIAHAPLEPRAAVAEWNDGKLTVWTGTQRPFGVQQELAEVFGLDKEKIRVIMPDTGSGYGGKHSGEAAIEAARLAKEVKKPVKLIWTREEEFTWAYFRPGGVIEVNSGVKKDGIITAWEFHNYNSGGSGINHQYSIPNQKIEHHPSKTPLKQGSYRGLASTANVFARESHISDLAFLLEIDQLEFRLKNLEDERLKAVLKAAAKSFGWNTGIRQPGHGYGIGCGFEKGGYVAACAEVAINGNNEVQVIRLTEAFECGAIINPEHLENQILGSIVQGLGGALFEAIDFADGKILNPSFSGYRVPRFKDMPKIDIIMVNRKDLPSAGAGEAPIVGVAPAIRNAIKDASGVTLTNLPMIPNGALG